VKRVKPTQWKREELFIFVQLVKIGIIHLVNMNSEKFYDLVDEIQSRITNILINKGKEYSTNDNKLHNFDKAGKMSNQTREKALLGFLLKHQVSVDDIVNKIETELPSVEMLEEKITDILNYYILLEACIKDRINKK